MILMTACPTNQRLKAYTLGQLDEDASSELAEHLQACAVCQAELETIEEASDSLIASLRLRPPQPGYEAEPDCLVAVAKAHESLRALGSGDAPSSTSAFPLQIGEYEVIRPLGSGGMGQVYLARHTKLGREVAVKVVAGHRLASPRTRQRFEAEMRAIGQLSHPNIVTAHDARDVDGTAVLVTEYIAGMDLAKLTRQTGPLAVADACEIVRRVAAALEYTHGQGCVHRDVKPSNIMLSAAGEVKLLDLGLARLHCRDESPVDLTSTGQTMGTVDYIAPEQITDSRAVDIRADIYSLGCTLFKLLTGHAPFSEPQFATTFAKMTAHVHSPPPAVRKFRPDVPLGLGKLVESMLAKHPDQRPPRPQVLIDGLREFTVGADLQRLAAVADEAAASPAAESSSARIVSPPAFVSPRKAAPWSMVWAAGISGLLIGFCLGVVITVKFPDGSSLIVHGPDGTQVSLAAGEDPPAAGAAPSPASADASPTEPETFSPLQFAVLVNALDGERLAAAVRVLESAKQAADRVPVPTQAGTWYPAADGVTGDVEATVQGVRYVLVSRDPQDQIAWKDLDRHLSVTFGGVGSSRGTDLQLYFDDDLAAKMQRLSGANVNGKLGIIFHHRLVSAARIQEGFAKYAQLTGNFTHEEVRYLAQCLSGGLLEPPLPATQLPAKGQAGLPGVPQPPSNPNPLQVPETDAPVDDMQRTQQNLKVIGVALHNFHDAYRQLPGSANLREGGRSLPRGQERFPFPFSWRVALLPFLESNALFEEYRFDEPWDSEHNSRLLAKMPEVYRSPLSADDPADGRTHYLGVGGEAGVFGKSGGLAMRDILDGLYNTIAIVDAKCSVPWTKPEDLSIDRKGGFEPKDWLRSENLPILMCDGSVRLEAMPTGARLLPQITYNGGEVLDLKR